MSEARLTHELVPLFYEPNAIACFAIEGDHVVVAMNSQLQRYALRGVDVYPWIPSLQLQTSRDMSAHAAIEHISISHYFQLVFCVQSGFIHVYELESLRYITTLNPGKLSRVRTISLLESSSDHLRIAVVSHRHVDVFLYKDEENEFVPLNRMRRSPGLKNVHWVSKDTLLLEHKTSYALSYLSQTGSVSERFDPVPGLAAVHVNPFRDIMTCSVRKSKLKVCDTRTGKSKGYPLLDKVKHIICLPDCILVVYEHHLHTIPRKSSQLARRHPEAFLNDCADVKQILTNKRCNVLVSTESQLYFLHKVSIPCRVVDYRLSSAQPCDIPAHLRLIFSNTQHPAGYAVSRFIGTIQVQTLEETCTSLKSFITRVLVFLCHTCQINDDALDSIKYHCRRTIMELVSPHLLQVGVDVLQDAMLKFEAKQIEVMNMIQIRNLVDVFGCGLTISKGKIDESNLLYTIESIHSCHNIVAKLGLVKTLKDQVECLIGSCSPEGSRIIIAMDLLLPVLCQVFLHIPSSFIVDLHFMSEFASADQSKGLIGHTIASFEAAFQFIHSFDTSMLGDEHEIKQSIRAHSLNLSQSHTPHFLESVRSLRTVSRHLTNEIIEKQPTSHYHSGNTPGSDDRIESESIGMD